MGAFIRSTVDGMCADLTIIPDQRNTAADLARVHFFYKAVMFYCWNCRWLSHLERFKCIFLHYIMQGFIFVLIWDLVTASSITVQFSSGLLARQLCEWAVVPLPPVPADPAVTALLIIFGPQLPDSRTEHVWIRSTEQTRGPQTELLRPTFIRLIISCFHRNRLAA